jgi:hypothetical protein
MKSDEVTVWCVREFDRVYWEQSDQKQKQAMANGDKFYRHLQIEKETRQRLTSPDHPQARQHSAIYGLKANKWEAASELVLQGGAARTEFFNLLDQDEQACRLLAVRMFQKKPDPGTVIHGKSDRVGKSKKKSGRPRVRDGYEQLQRYPVYYAVHDYLILKPIMQKAWPDVDEEKIIFRATYIAAEVLNPDHNIKQETLRRRLIELKCL